MSNSTWVCFDCKRAVRRERFAGRVGKVDPPFCSQCGRQCVELGHRIPLPSKRDTKGWNELRKQLEAQAIAQASAQYEQNIRQNHQLEKQLLKLEALPTNEARQRSIRALRRQIDAL